MPWCPICKTEYREGITVCADCKCDLIDSLEGLIEKKSITLLRDEPMAEKLVKFLAYENIEAEYAFDESEDAFAVLVAEADYKRAKSVFQGFYQVESQKEMQNKMDEAIEKAETEEAEDLSEEELREKALEDLVYTSAGVYVKKSDQSKEMFSTAITFCVFGALLFAFMLLNAFGVITLFSNIISLIILTVLAIGCLIVGINAVGRAKKAGEQSVEEDKVTAAINDYMKSVVTPEFLASADDAELSPELNYLRRIDAIKASITEKFGELDDTFVDSLIEDFYNSNISD